jgi:predicted transcriptional regulator
MEKDQTRNRAKLNVSIDASLKEEMVQLSRTDGRSISWMIEAALRQYLKGMGMRVPARGKGAARRTGGQHARPRP